MIELRWVWRSVPIDEHTTSKERVLQYREGNYPYQPPYEETWKGTDWRDVPTGGEEA